MAFFRSGQHCQQLQIPAFGQRADDGHKVAMAFEERNLVDPHSRERFEGVPINATRDPAVEDAQQRVVAHILFFGDIAERAVDQLDDQVALVGFGMQRIRVIPVELLRGRRMVVAERATEALGTNA